ncbi:unnamed protein product [Phyllotreta striolata]|uniref:Protein msta n=1 Tax=Phyllotreta striolata TaxID=444603 RepID=A0A9N9TXS0_PHYSR|nr:unnamed protein product [Phyllotreta striolata]
MSDEAKCEVCDKQASHRCSSCHNARYCCREHQKAHWKQHKPNCRPFKICKDDVLGRHAKATKAINPGEVILQEHPLIWGPALNTIPVCLGCCKPVDENNSKPCSKCGWPMCSSLCEQAPCHIPECRYTVLKRSKISIKNFGITHPSYGCVTVLRILYQKQFLPEIWKKLDLLQSHCEERKGTQNYHKDRMQIAQFILKFFKLGSIFTEEDILKVCGILTVNSHEVPLTNPPHIAIYEKTSMFEHNCSSNCSKTFTSKGNVVLVAGSRVNKGDNLSICYTDPLWGTANRRHHLNESKYFWCTCKRCSDPTELGTYFSALRCQDSNCKGFLLPKTFLDNHTNENERDWHCTRCPSSISWYSVQDLLDRIGTDLSEMPKGDPAECKSFLKTYEELLHPNHYYLTDVKLALLQMLGNDDDEMKELDEDDLQLKLKLCQNLVGLVKNLAPGERRILGFLLYKLHGAVAETGRRKNSPDVIYGSLMESKKILEEAVDLLKHQPIELPEGKLHKEALANLKELGLVIETIHKTIGELSSPL